MRKRKRRDEVKAGLREEGCARARLSEQNNRKPTGQINDMRSQLDSYYTRETLESCGEEWADVVRRSSAHQPLLNGSLIAMERWNNSVKFGLHLCMYDIFTTKQYYV